MPRRQLIFSTNNIYHIYNRTIDGRIIYKNDKEYIHALKCFDYYKYQNPNLKFSNFLKLTIKSQADRLKILKVTKKSLVSVIAYCLMPDHFHFLVRMEVEYGIPKFAADFQNSYTKYFNTKYDRVGPIFLPRFKAVKIETENQLLHVSRYIHLNPYSAGIVSSFEQLMNYPWSSLKEYISPGEIKAQTCNRQVIMHHFKKNSTYKNFVFNQAGYQRSLKQIRQALLEK